MKRNGVAGSAGAPGARCIDSSMASRVAARAARESAPRIGSAGRTGARLCAHAVLYPRVLRRHRSARNRGCPRGTGASAPRRVCGTDHRTARIAAPILVQRLEAVLVENSGGGLTANELLE